MAYCSGAHSPGSPREKLVKRVYC